MGYTQLSRGEKNFFEKSMIFLDCHPSLPLTMGSEQEGRSASMTVKEVEERTGLPRANIRYYESEGLIHPARGENGYRDYHSLLLFWRRGAAEVYTDGIHSGQRYGSTSKSRLKTLDAVGLIL